MAEGSNIIEFHTGNIEPQNLENGNTSITTRLNAADIPGQRAAVDKRLRAGLPGDTTEQSAEAQLAAYDKLYESDAGLGVVTKYKLGNVYIDSMAYHGVKPETKALLVDKFDRVLGLLEPSALSLLIGKNIVIESSAGALVTLGKQYLHSRLYSTQETIHISLEDSPSANIARALSATLEHLKNLKAYNAPDKRQAA